MTYDVTGYVSQRSHIVSKYLTISNVKGQEVWPTAGHPMKVAYNK